MRLIGYGGMLTESFVAIMALITAAIINQHLYFTMNAPAAQTGTTAQTAADYVNKLGLSGAPITPGEITAAAQGVGEKSIISRTGGAPTLAFGMSEVLHQVFGGTGLKAFWYHFAIMFEALFILTTVDAGTRVARFMLSDGLGNLGGPLKKLQNPSWRVGAWICSVIVVAAWGSILLMGVTDPLGGINTLFPLFGIANQLLAAIALTVVTVVVVKRGLVKWAWIPALPLFWDLIVTLTASWQKIFSADPKLGYWKQHSICQTAQAAGKLCLTAKSPADVDKIVRNTFIQGTLSIVFASVVVIVFIAGVIVVLKSLQGTGRPLTEDEPVPSRIFAPSGLIPTKTEREVQKQWDALPSSHAKSVGTGAH
jgi:carbon starvation protein